MILTRLQTLNEAMAANEGSRAKEAFSEAVGIITIYKQNSFLQDLSYCVLNGKFFYNLMQIDEGCYGSHIV